MIGLPLLQVSDAALVSRALAGSHEAFEALVLRHQRRVHAVARAAGVPASAADDVAQEAFLAAFRDLGSLREPARFAPWLLGIARNAARQQLRRGIIPPLAGEGIAGTVADDAVSIAERCEAAELREHVRRKVAELPDGVREAVFLYYYEGRSARQAARALGTTRAAVKKRLQKGRDLLRESLWRELGAALRELLPSARAWRAKGRGLALVLMTALPASRPAAAAAAAAGRGASSGVGAAKAALATDVVLGGLFMSAKKVIVAAVVAALLLGLGGVVLLKSRRPPFPDGLAKAPAAATAAPAPSRVDGEDADGASLRAETASLMAPAAALRVRVLDEAGEDIAGAGVRASWGTSFDAGGGRLATRVRGEEALERTAAAEFVAGQAQGDVVIVTAAASGYLPRRARREMPPGGLAETVVLRLLPGEQVRIRLYDPRRGDQPVVGARAGSIAGSPSDLWAEELERLTEGRAWQDAELNRLGLPPGDLDARAPVDLLYEVLSDADGEVSLPSLPGTAWVARDGYGPVALRLYADQRPDSNMLCQVPMHSSTTLRLAVRRGDGAPVEGFHYSVGEDFWSLADPTRRVEGGEVLHEIYQVCRLSPEPWLPRKIAVAVRSGELNVKTEVKVAYGEENVVDIVLKSEPVAILGRVLDSEERPVAGAEVAAVGPAEVVYVVDDEVRRGGDRQVRTGPDGGYEVPFPSRPEPFYLLVRHPDHPLHLSDGLRLEPNERRRHDVQLPRAAVITARLADRVTARAGIEVELSNEGTPAHPRLTYTRKVKTDAGGAARFENVHAGPWTLIWTDGRLLRRLPVCVEAGKSYEFVLGEAREGAGIDLAGTLVAAGAPVAGQDLWLGGDDGNVIGIATSDAGGAFRFREVPAGKRSLALYPSAGRPGAPIHYLQIEVEEGMAPLRLDLTAATVTGRVLSANGPLAAVTVKPYTLQGTFLGGETLASFHSAQTGADGTFRLPWMLPAPALLVFEKAGYVTRRVEWRPRGALEDDIGEVRLEESDEGGRIRFRVVEAESGAEIDRVLLDLHAVDLQGPMHVARIHRQAAAEELAVEALPAGRYRAFVRPGDVAVGEYASQDVEFDHAAGADQVVEVRARRGGNVILELRSDDGRLPRAATVEVVDAEGKRALAWDGSPTLKCSACGILLGLPLGPLEARVTAPGWKPLAFRFEVEPGRMGRIVQRVERE